MKEVECKADFSGVETRTVFLQSSLTLHVEHEVPSSHEFDDEEEAGRSLEARVKTHEERMVRGGLEDVLLGLHPVYVLRNEKSKTRPRRQTFIEVDSTKKM